MITIHVPNIPPHFLNINNHNIEDTRHHNYELLYFYYSLFIVVFIGHIYIGNGGLGRLQIVPDYEYCYCTTHGQIADILSTNIYIYIYM